MNSRKASASFSSDSSYSSYNRGRPVKPGHFGNSVYTIDSFRDYSATRPVKETTRIQKRYDSLSGRKIINRYEIIGLIGRGVHGKVKLARELTTNNFVAIKTLEKDGRKRFGRSESTSQEQKIKREIAILKKCIHPHVVRLIEVMDDPMSRKIYLVLEYMEGGEILWRDSSFRPALTLEQARHSFRDVVLGLEYLHFQNVIHRDIKPANLLWTQSRSVKISDFGVSYISSGESSRSADIDYELAKTAGTPAFFAPELCWSNLHAPRPKITKAIDTWALGVTLYCLIYGQVPFTADSEFELFQKIANQPLEFPKDRTADSEVEDLLVKLLTKDPDERIKLEEVKRHPFTLNGLENSEAWLKNTDPANYELVEVSQQDMNDAVSIVDKLRRSFRKIQKTVLNITDGLKKTHLSDWNISNNKAKRAHTMLVKGTSSKEKPRNSQRIHTFSPSAYILFEKSRVYTPPTETQITNAFTRRRAENIKRYRSVSECYLPQTVTSERLSISASALSENKQRNIRKRASFDYSNQLVPTVLYDGILLSTDGSATTEDRPTNEDSQSTPQIIMKSILDTDQSDESSSKSGVFIKVKQNLGGNVLDYQFQDA